MTTTVQQERQGGSETRTSQPATTVSPREQAIQAIMQTHGRGRRRANAEVRLMERIVAQARRNDYEWVYPTQEQLSSRAYRDLRADIPHGVESATGTIHRLLEVATLDPRRGEYGFCHDLSGIRDEEMYCGMLVMVHAVR